MQSKHLKRMMLYVLTVLSSGFGAQMAQAAKLPVDWLNDMHHAIHNLNYAGPVVYQVGSNVAVMQLEHTAHAEHEVEQLHSLNGQPHEIVRRPGALSTQQTPHPSIPLAGLTPRQHTLGLNCLFNYQQMAPHYQIRLGAQHRIANRTTQIIDIKPLDTLRFGRRLYLDQETKLPLRSVLLNHVGKPLAQTLFVDFQLTPSKPNIQAQHIHSTAMQPKSHRYTASTRWRFEQLPIGFDMMMHNDQRPKHQAHFIFSDGLSMVSLYLEPWSNEGMAGYSKRGATWILGTRKYNHRVTLLGEVPKMTLQKMADAIRPVYQ